MIEHCKEFKIRKKEELEEIIQEWFMRNSKKEKV